MVTASAMTVRKNCVQVALLEGRLQAGVEQQGREPLWHVTQLGTGPLKLVKSRLKHLHARPNPRTIEELLASLQQTWAVATGGTSSRLHARHSTNTSARPRPPQPPRLPLRYGQHMRPQPKQLRGRCHHCRAAAATNRATGSSAAHPPTTGTTGKATRQRRRRRCHWLKHWP